ncbi:MAG: virulence RhuM family protein [Paludibacteraceae bacterium]|nr:virulence RhuM family protein [Paludibacteraceae bacterium]
MKDEIVLYQPNETIQLEVHLKDETVWLTQQQIADLFGVKQPAISKHIANIYKSGELDEEGTYSILEYMGHDGKQLYTTKAYNLDMILSVGYRVNSTNATRFRQWANRVLKDYLLRGYAFNQRLANIEHQMDEQRAILASHEEKIDFFVRTSLPPVEGIFYDGEIYEAYSFVSDLIRSAKTRIVLIDNYIDDRVLTMLDKRNDGIKATIYTKNFTKQLSLDIEQHNKQFAPINVEPFNLSHDRFMIIDDVVYHIGASLKDLGKAWFAFTKMNDISAEELLGRIK